MASERALKMISGKSWAIMPDKLTAIAEFLELRAINGKLTAEEIEARIGPKRGRPKAIQGGVAVLPLYGVISHHQELMANTSGGTSIDQFAADFDALVKDDRVGAIVIDADSGGGGVPLITETSKMIFDARGIKSIVAVVNSLAASAAYWLVSSANTVVVTPSGELGSIGIVGIHEDQSEAESKMGIKTTMLFAGKHKTLGNPHEPLSDDGRARIQQRLDTHYEMFVRDVARNRGVTAAAVRGGFAEGDVVGADEAVKLNMADRVGTLASVVADLERRRSSAGQRSRALRMASAMN